MPRRALHALGGGGALICRRCGLWVALRPPRTRIHGPKAVDVEVEAVLPFPREVVASYAGDPSHAPEWYANITSITWRSPPPVATGSTMEFDARFLGRRLTYTYAVVELVAGERMVMRTADGPFPMETTYTWQSVAGGTLMRLRNRGTPTGFARLTGPAMRRAMKRAMTKDLARLGEQLRER